MDTLISASVLAALDKVVLERRADGTFIQCGDAPGWFRRLHQGRPRPDEPIDVESLFPFLEVFLPEAEQVWREDGPESLDSDLWCETAEGGEELPLEAAALRIGSRRFLVITRSDAIFRERGLLLQRARELRLTYDALSREIERKDVLVHCIVHDLASPLHVILGALSSLDEQTLPDASASLVKLALGAALRQRAMIREILSVFAFGRGGAAAPHEEAATSDLHAEITQIVEALSLTARRRSVRIERDPVPPGGACRVIADEARLVRVLSNLLENAIRHSPIGGRVRVTTRDQGATVEVSVQDEGPGVDPSLVPRLFQQFGRGEGSSAGTGLGLYFCRITVERWGGAIGYDSAGDGPRFWFRLRKASDAPGQTMSGTAAA